MPDAPAPRREVPLVVLLAERLQPEPVADQLNRHLEPVRHKGIVITHAPTLGTPPVGTATEFPHPGPRRDTADWRFGRPRPGGRPDAGKGRL
ncbi:hypothetical protein GCM10009731_26960 [Streptomyces globosus]